MITLTAPSSSSSAREVVLRPLKGGVVNIVLQEKTMLGNVEQIGATVLLSELAEAVARMEATKP